MSLPMPQPSLPIVIVEDDEGMRRAMARLLKAAGYSTVAFESGEALLQAGAAEHAACFVFDVRLPGISGFELRRQLSPAGTGVPVIFVSAHEPPPGEPTPQIGVAAHLLKPFTRQALLDAIERAMPTVPNEGC